MGTFYVEVPLNSGDIDQQMDTVSERILQAFAACEAAEITLHKMPDEAISLEVVYRPPCDATLMGICLSASHWRHDP